VTDQITPQQFHDASGVDDWRVVFEGACTHFVTGSFADGIGLVGAIGRLADAADQHLKLDVRDGGVAAAVAAGGRVVFDKYAPAWWTLADPEGNEVDIATWQGRD
jgi:hypothetical protein